VILGGEVGMGTLPPSLSLSLGGCDRLEETLGKSVVYDEKPVCWLKQHQNIKILSSRKKEKYFVRNSFVPFFS